MFVSGAQKKKRQNIIKAQLEKWKESEEDNARLQALAQIKITRPKTADAGQFLIYDIDVVLE